MIRGALTILVLAAVAAPTAFSGEPPAAAKESKPPAPNLPIADRLPPTDFAIRLTIADCVLAAVRNNIDLRRARLADQQAELDRRSALAEFLPTLSASGNRSHLQDKRGPESDATDGSVAVTQKTPLGATITGRASQSHADTEGAMDNSSSVSAELRQPLLAGAGPAAAFYTYRTAQISRAASAGDLDRQGQSTVFQVRKLYWSAIQNQASLQANRRALASADYFLKATQAREEAGQASKLDVSNAQIQRSSREVALNLAESALENSLDDLKTALDLPLGEKVALTSPAEYAPAARDPAKLRTETLAGRPDLAAARLRLETIRLDLERKRRNAWPSLDLVASQSLSGSGGSSDAAHAYDQRTTSVGLELTLPLGLVAERAARQKAELELERGKLDLRRREVEAEGELRGVLRALAAAELNVASYRQRVEAAKLAAAAAQALYERGKASSFDVVRAEDDLLAAELGLASSLADCLSRAAELDLVAGRPLGRLLPAPKAAPAPPKHKRAGI